MRADREKNIKLWSWLLAVLLTLIMLYGCTTTKYVPVNQIRHITTIERDTIVELVTPPESVTNTTTDTTSVIATRYATSTATVSNGVLTHNLTQHARKDSVKSKTIYIHVADSVPYPVEVEKTKEVVPTWSWWSLGFNAIAIMALTLYVINIIKKIIPFP